MTARLLDCSPDEYYSIPAFSQTVATTLIRKSPAHAKHDMENGRAATSRMDRGNVIGRMVLGKGKDYKVLEFDDWRTNKAKEAREHARSEGLIPILAEAHKDAYHAAMAIMKELAARGVKLDGDSEQAMEWDEETPDGPLRCKGMMDHLTGDLMTIYDLKIVESAAPDSIERSAENFGYGIQRAAYTSGHAKVFPALAGRARMLFIFAEPDPPNAVNIVEPDGMFRELGERRWQRACATWAHCLRDNHWPAYGRGINNLSVPGWALAREGYTTEEQ